MKRLFAAIKINPDENFMQLYYGLKNSCKYDRINWVKPENIHITLKFFGDTNESKIEKINNLLHDISSQHKSFSLSLENVGIFGSSYKPRVIWFGINPNEALVDLTSEIHAKLETIGFINDRQNFVPHLTVGRIKYIDDKNQFTEKISEIGSLHIQNIFISDFYLYESILKSTGPEYHTIDKFSLNT